MDLAGRCALVTGGGTGLGLEVSRQLAAVGADIAVSYSRSEAEAESAVGELMRIGVRARAFRADLARVSEAERLVAAVGTAFGRLDILIHNAATTRFIPFPDIEAVTEEAWDEIFAVNTRAAFFLARAAAPLLRRDGGGQIITTSSIAGIGRHGSSLPYCVSKAALIHLTKCLATALAPEIRVNSVAPGLLLTRWVEGFGDERLVALSEAALLKKATDLTDTAAAFLMLARNDSMTGQVIVVDAGLLDA